MQKNTNIKDVYPLSPLQKGLLFHSIYQKDASAYFVQVSYHILGALEIELVKYALQQLVNRHDILRTSFVYEEMDKPLQVVLKEKTIPLYFEDISHLNREEEQKDYLENYKAKDKKAYFDLTHDCLMRVAIFQLGEEEFEFIWSFHHLIIDGWCVKILENEFFAFYEAIKSGETLKLPEAFQYKSYIQWLDQQPSEEASLFWKEYLEDYAAPANIPKIIPQHAPIKHYNNDKITFEVPKALEEGLKKIAQQNRSTLNNVVRVLWGLLLAKYNDQKDIIFGAVVSGRSIHLEGLEDIVGLFINTIPVRVLFDSTTSFSSLLQNVTNDALRSEKYHHCTLAEIQDLSELKQQLFDHIIVFENYPTTVESSRFFLPGEEETNTSFLKLLNESAFSQNHYPFYIIIGTRPHLEFNFYYNKELYSKELVAQFFEQLCFLMEQCVLNDQIEISQLKLVKPESKAFGQLISDWNKTDKDFQLQSSIKTCFETTVNQNPTRTAIHYQDKMYSYKELNTISNRLSAYLNNQRPAGDGPHFVGILTNRPDHAIISMLACVKSGLVFAPIHPDLPTSNVENIFGAIQPFALCMDSSLFDKTSSYSGELFALDIQLEVLPTQDENPKLEINPEAPLYTIFSSGTTGTPKGVMISNKSLLNYYYWFKDDFGFDPTNRGALLSSYAFDLGYTTIWGCLLSGAALYLPDRVDVIEPNRLLNYLLEHQISFLKLTPSHLKILLAANHKLQLKDSHLALILLGGEKIHTESICDFLAIKPNTQFVNHYGPTETTIGIIRHKIEPTTIASYSQFPYIGLPNSNNKAFILDEAGHLLPTGAKGDLYLSGNGLALQYWGQPELTNQKFKNSFWGERLYHSGDKARRHMNGEIEFLGRADSELKIRGYRVNTEDIEKSINQHADVNLAIVRALEDSAKDKSIVAFIQWKDEVKNKELENYLQEQLPVYMLPQELVVIDQVPVTPNGKLAIKALQKLRAVKEEKILTRPANDTEKHLLNIWQEVLEKEAISTDEDFFDLGGHSLKAVQVISRIIKFFGITIEVKDLFDYPTIQSLAQVLDNKMDTDTLDHFVEEILI